MFLEIDDKQFNINYESNVEYNKLHSLCDCPGCKNYYMQAENEMPKLKNFLEKFGIDVTKPDEIGWGDIADGKLDYVFVSYTVSGEILKHDGYEIDIFENEMCLNIVIDDKYIPNERNDKRYFTLTVYNVKLPYILTEPLVTTSKSEKTKDILSFFRKK